MPETCVAAIPRRQRIVAFGSKGPPSVRGAGGIERGIEQLAPFLEDLGFEFIAYARANRCNWLHHKGIRYRGTRYIDSKNMAPLTHSLSSFWDYLKHRVPNDVIFVHGIDKAFLCPLFSRLGHRVIFVLHGQEWRACKWGPAMRRFMHFCRLPMLRFSDAVVTVCRPSFSELARIYPKYAHKLRYLPNGLPSLSRPHADLTAIENASFEADRFFLYSGRIVPQKRLDTVLLALAGIPGDVPLVIAGSHSHTQGYLNYLHSLIIKNRLEGRVHFVGHLSLDQLVGLYATCRAVVLPSETEGCSQTILEAIACGCCVICSDLPENLDVAADAAIYVKAGDINGLKEAMTAVLDDSKLKDWRRRISARQNGLPGWMEIARKFGELSTGYKQPDSIASG